MKMSFSDTLKQLRIKAGYTQKQVYEMIGVPQSTFSSWEIGKSEPSADTLLHLCQIYGIEDVLTAFGYDGYKEDGSLQLNMYEIDIIEKYRNLDTYGQKTVNIILDRETDRVKQLEDASHREQNCRIIDYHQRSASAGSGQIIFDDMPTDPIEIPLIPEYKCVGYAIGVNGDSMEPLYKDGDILLIEPTNEVRIGEIGIFLVNGEAFVKQLGDGELISLNKDRDNIPLTTYSNCMGRVVDKLR